MDADVLGDALKETGFVICEFPADDDPCECCGKTNLQHYWRRSDPFSSDGTYYCAQCVVDEYTANNEAPNAEVRGCAIAETKERN